MWASIDATSCCGPDLRSTAFLRHMAMPNALRSFYLLLIRLSHTSFGRWAARGCESVTMAACSDRRGPFPSAPCESPMPITSLNSAGTNGQPAAGPACDATARQVRQRPDIPPERQGPLAARPVPAHAAGTPAPRGRPPARAGMPAAGGPAPQQVLGRLMFGAACLGIAEGAYRMGQAPGPMPPKVQVVASVVLSLVGAVLEHRAAAQRGASASPRGAGRLALELLSTGISAGAIGYTSFTLSRQGRDRLDAWALPQAARSAMDSIVSGALLLVFMTYVFRLSDQQRHRPELRGLPLHQVILGFAEPHSAAGRFDWKAEGLFMDTQGRDMRSEVSHVLARIIDFATQPTGADIAPALHGYLDGLATRAELRRTLAEAAADANATCDDRVGLRLGELMLAESLDRATDPAAMTPRDVVHTLVLHAAVRAMESHIGQLMGPDQVPSADLLLAGGRDMQLALRSRGFDVPEVFPRRLYVESGDRELLDPVARFAASAADALASPSGTAPRAAAVVRLLGEQGGTVGRAVLDARLGHLSGDLLAGLHRQLEALDDEKESGRMTDLHYKAAADGLMQAYEKGLVQLRERAIGSALEGGTDGWLPAPGAAAATNWAPVQSAQGDQSAHGLGAATPLKP